MTAFKLSQHHTASDTNSERAEDTFVRSMSQMSNDKLCVKCHEAGYKVAWDELLRRKALSTSDWPTIVTSKETIGISELALLRSKGAARVNERIIQSRRS